MAVRYERGRIYLVEMPDQRGVNPKVRPAMLLSQDDDEAEGDRLIFVGITTTYNPRALNESEYALPYVDDDHGDRETRLKRPSCLVCSWIVRVAETDVVRRLGTVPDIILDQAIDYLRTQGFIDD